MKRQFANDSMMSELHAIREKHYQQTQSAPATKRNHRRGNRLVSFLSSYGYQLVPTKRGTRKLVRGSNCHRDSTLAEGQVGWLLYRLWYETERVHESLGYQTPSQRLSDGDLTTGLSRQHIAVVPGKPDER